MPVLGFPVPRMEEEDGLCFQCKDGGTLIICDHEDCQKAYHPLCAGKDDSFMNAGALWSCSWHLCSGCQNPQKKLKIQCFCCPTSICEGCVKGSDFVQVKKDKGFCSHCLKLAKLIEENVDEDSDGEKVDFKATDTYEYLFKDYWEIIKGREKLTLEDLRAAHSLLNRGEHLIYPSDSEHSEEYIPSDTFEVIHSNADLQPHENKRAEIRNKYRKQSQKKKNFIGWCSKELISFLKSIGKDTDVPISQMEVTEIINRYAQSKNLYDPNKKKKQILCDEKLISLFRRRSVKKIRIPTLLDSHYPSNESDYDFNSGLEEECRKKQKTTSGSEIKSSPSIKLPKDQTHCSASLARENVKLVYLRRSLVQSLLSSFDDFETKVVGSFVRVKNDVNDLFYSPNRIYQLGQVTGIKKTGQPYKMGGITTDVVLSVSNVWKEVPISLLSEDDFEERECEDLRQLARSGAFQIPTVAQLQQKANLLHRDITSHWLTKEIARLEKQIDLANEKGWRKERLEHIERRENLLRKEEQERLLREKPEVIPEQELVIEDKSSQPRTGLQKEG